MLFEKLPVVITMIESTLEPEHAIRVWLYDCAFRQHKLVAVLYHVAHCAEQDYRPPILCPRIVDDVGAFNPPWRVPIGWPVL